MCLVAVAWRAHPRYPLIVAGNRDEFHARATAPAGWWHDHPQVFGGRDLVAGGSWLAVSRSGRLAMVINDPRRPPGPERTASRGHLVRDFVAGDRPSGRFLDAVSVAESRYAGFCLIVGTPVQLRGFVSSRGGAPHRWTLRPGVAAYSNGPIENPWPKATKLENELARLVGCGEISEASLFELLDQRTAVSGDPGLDIVRHTPFVRGDTYGTRASTVLTVDEGRHCRFVERRFDPQGSLSGESSVEFMLD